MGQCHHPAHYPGAACSIQPFVKNEGRSNGAGPTSPRRTRTDETLDRLYVKALDGFNPRLLVGLAIAAAVVFAGLLSLDASGAMDISTGETVVIFLRLFVPLLILRFWVTGGIVSMLLDGADVIITDALDMGGFGDHYAELDKVLDSYYLTLELLVAFGWRNAWARLPAVALFAYRLVGVVLFELSEARIFLFIFPNMFENWWLYVVVVMKWFPRAVPHDRRTVIIPMLALLVPKMAQEYLLHFAEAKPWNWTQRKILEPIGIDF